MRQMLIPISSLKKPSKNGTTLSGATAQKCGKKEYEIKIFVVRDQNMTKKTFTRQMLITIKDLQKQLKMVRKTPFRQLPTAQNL